MDFIKKHYEKIILCVVLLGVVGALVALPFVVQADKDAMKAKTDLVIAKPKDLPALDMTTENDTLARVQNPYLPDFATSNKLFNPVLWKKNGDGDLIKATTGHEIDASAAVVTNITALYSIWSLERVETNTGIIYVIGVEHQAAASRAGRAKQTRFGAVGQKEDSFTITQVKGDPADPSELILKLADTGELVSVSKTKPYKRADAYVADLRFDPEKKVFQNRRETNDLTFGGDVYKIVAIHQDEVILLAQSNQKKTVLHYSH